MELQNTLELMSFLLNISSLKMLIPHFLFMISVKIKCELEKLVILKEILTISAFHYSRWML